MYAIGAIFQLLTGNSAEGTPRQLGDCSSTKQPYRPCDLRGALSILEAEYEASIDSAEMGNEGD